MQVDLHAAIVVSKNNLEEDVASTPTMSGCMKDKKAELYFSTGESTTVVTEASTTPRQRPKMQNMESHSASHQKTPKMSNMRHLLGPLTEDLASPQRPTPWNKEAPRKMIDTSSSSSNNADSNTVSGDPSNSSLETVKEKHEYRATATSAKKQPLSKTPGIEETLVVKHLLGRDQENKNAPHALTQLREGPQRQQSFEFPVLGSQQPPDSIGVIWNLDPPLEQSDPQQVQTVSMPPPHFTIPACSGRMTRPRNSFPADPWSSATLRESLPRANWYAPTFSHVYGGPTQSSQQPHTAEQCQGATMGVFMASSSFEPGSDYFKHYSQPQDSLPAHHSAHSMPESHERIFYQPIQNMHMMRPASKPAPMVRPFHLGCVDVQRLCVVNSMLCVVTNVIMQWTCLRGFANCRCNHQSCMSLHGKALSLSQTH